MKHISLMLFILTCVGCFVLSNELEAKQLLQSDEILQTFKQMFEVLNPNIVVPTVVEITVPNQIYSQHFAVYNKTKNIFEPYYIGDKSGSKILQPDFIRVNGAVYNKNIFDANFETQTEFDIDDEGRGDVRIEYTFSNTIESDSLYLSLDQYVALPNVVTVKVLQNGKEKTILSKIKPDSHIINFPKTSAQTWIIEMEYSQWLRIKELQIHNSYSTYNTIFLRFLAQPNTEYVIYADPDRIINQITNERPNLVSDIDVKNVSIGTLKSNPVYVLSDRDNDTVPDIYDNCVVWANPNQDDINGNKRGDVCDDFDKDNLINAMDNCVTVPNIKQEDTDGDGIGDVCDEEESRITEKYPWIVWGGISFAGLLFLSLFAIAIRRMRFADTQDGNIVSSSQDNTFTNSSIK
jgi:hypothetical protein